VYDVKGEPHEFIGERRDDVIAKACEFFGVDQDALEIADFPSGEIYGLGGRCLIVAGVRGAQSGARSSERSERRDGPSGEQPRRGSEHPGRGGRRERGGRGDRGGRGERSDRPARGERSAPAAAEPQEPSIGTASGELGEVGAFVLGLVERMDIGPFDISENREGDLLIFEIRGAGAAELARGEGRSVDAIQLLANQAASRGSDEPPRVVIDVEGNDEARELLLSRLAERVAGRARDTGRAVALDPMNGRDRRLIHLALREEEDIATMSIGEGRYRQVVVVPEGAPEFEDARREAEAAAARTDS
jgi:spoIIIJ-associated protein